MKQKRINRLWRQAVKPYQSFFNILCNFRAAHTGIFQLRALHRFIIHIRQRQVIIWHCTNIPIIQAEALLFQQP